LDKIKQIFPFICKLDNKNKSLNRFTTTSELKAVINIV